MKELTPEMIEKVAQRLRALADESRIRLLLRLKESPANVSTLTADLGIAQASVSKHLGVLKQVGLVEAERNGTQAVYRVRDESVFDLCEIVCGGVMRFMEQEHRAVVAGSTRRKATWRSY
jgi:DNA-binding transcriptional ArsR family regulator